MSKKHRRIRNDELTKKIVLATKRRLVPSIALLIGITVCSIFKVGGVWWPMGMLNNQGLFIAINVLLIIFLSLMSPIILEYTRDPKVLHDPGKDPRHQ